MYVPALARRASISFTDLKFGVARILSSDMEITTYDRSHDAWISGVAAEPSLTHKGYTMVYPLGEGPIMTVLGGYSPGTVMKVRVVKPLSAGLLLGEVLREDD